MLVLDKVGFLVGGAIEKEDEYDDKTTYIPLSIRSHKSIVFHKQIGFAREGILTEKSW